MSKTVTTTVDGVDGDGNPFHYEAGDEVPAEHAKLISNPAVWEGAEHPAHSPDDHRPGLKLADLGLEEDTDLDALHDTPDEFSGMDRAALEAEADARDVSFTKSTKDETLRDKLRASASG